jgi:hypothetical protein
MEKIRPGRYALQMPTNECDSDKQAEYVRECELRRRKRYWYALPFVSLFCLCFHFLYDNNSDEKFVESLSPAPSKKPHVAPRANRTAGNACIARLCEVSQSASGVSHDVYEKTNKESIVHGMETTQAAGLNSTWWRWVI